MLRASDGFFLCAKMEEEKKNAISYPSIFYAKHMETGLCGYENETILIDGDNLKNMIPTFVGKPVYVHHQEVDLDNLKEQAHGYIVESFYNEIDGWLWVKMLLVDDIAKQAVANGWSVSNAYIPTEWGAGGTHHNVPYDRKIVNGEFTHLAIVPNPRYEEAKILSPDEFKTYQSLKKERLEELHNSLSTKEQKGNTMFKFFKNVKQEVSSVDSDTLVEIKNAKGEASEVKISEMVDALLNAKKNESDAKEKDKAEEGKEEGEKVNMGATIRVGNEDMTIGDLVNAYNNMLNAKKNADEEAEKKEKEEKENSKSVNHFEELKNANSNFKPEVTTIELSMDKLARGKQRYSL